MIDGWFQRWPGANVGIATGEISGVVVLDLDFYHEGCRAACTALMKECGRPPVTRAARTGGGGRHEFFEHPGYPVRNSSGKLGDGIDVRGEGGYVVAAPSLHRSGNRYEWVDESVPMGVWPQSFSDKLDAGRVEQVAAPFVPAQFDSGDGTRWGLVGLRGALDELAAAMPGDKAGRGRNDVLNKKTYRVAQLVAGGQLRGEWTAAGCTGAYEQLYEMALSLGSPEYEVRDTMRSAITGGEKYPRTPKVAGALK